MCARCTVSSDAQSSCVTSWSKPTRSSTSTCRMYMVPFGGSRGSRTSPTERRFRDDSVEMDALLGQRFSRRMRSRSQFTGALVSAPPPCLRTVTSTNAHLPSVAKSPLRTTKPKSNIVRVMSEPRPVLSGHVTRTCASMSLDGITETYSSSP